MSNDEILALVGKLDLKIVGKLSKYKVMKELFEVYWKWVTYKYTCSGIIRGGWVRLVLVFIVKLRQLSLL